VRGKVWVPAVVIPVLVAVDIVTKRWALEALAGGRQLEILWGLLPLTLAFNQGAAFGLRIGSDPRMVFIPLTIVTTIFLLVVLLRAAPDDRLRIWATSLVIAGAIGNLIDRVRWERGVVDFLGPVNLGFTDFPIFNVADIAITCGAILLAISFWKEEQELRHAAQVESTAGERPPHASGSGEGV